MNEETEKEDIEAIDSGCNQGHEARWVRSRNRTAWSRLSFTHKNPQVCEKIDKGDFYIACAMGLHRTDIALCTYWVFYAADKGIAPPPIRGYRQEEGHNTNKIMRVLNAFYQHRTEIDGKEPVQIEVFRNARK